MMVSLRHAHLVSSLIPQLHAVTLCMLAYVNLLYVVGSALTLHMHAWPGVSIQITNEGIILANASAQCSPYLHASLLNANTAGRQACYRSTD